MNKPVPNKVKIPIEYKWPPLLVVFLLFIGAFPLYITLADSLLLKRQEIIAGLFFYFLISIGIFFAYFKIIAKPYLSYLEIENGNLTLVFKKRTRIINTKVVPLKDIKAFDVVLDLNVRDISYRIHFPKICANTQIIIKTTQEIIPFSNKTKFGFMLNLLRNSHYIPNFSYKINGNAIDELPHLKNEIEHNMVYRKKMTLSQSLPYILQYNVKMFPFIISIITFVLYGIYILLRKYGII